MRVSVIGTGYLGAVHAAGMADLGFDVVGVDVDPAKVATLQRGEAPFYEPGLEPLLRKHVEAGRLRFTTDLAEVGGRGGALPLRRHPAEQGAATPPTSPTSRTRSPGSPRT